jgi:hypothetical protein
MRFDTTHEDWPGHLKRIEGLGKRLSPEMSTCMWGAMAGNLAWEMCKIVGRHGRVWAQEPDSLWTNQAKDLFVIPNLTWCDKSNIQRPDWTSCDVCVIDWVPHGGDLVVLEQIQEWPILNTVSSIMTEQHDDSIQHWMEHRGFSLAPDSEKYHTWWDKK